MADITSDLFVVTCGVIIVIVVLAVTFIRLRSAERRMHESSYKLKAYTDLLNAVTEINLAGADSDKMDIAKKNLALTLNRAQPHRKFRRPQERQRPAGFPQRAQGKRL